MATSTISISVKIVGGQGCNLTVQKDISITELKRSIESMLSIPITQQKLLFKGKPLIDGKNISDYNVEDGAMLYLMKNKESSAGSSSSDSGNVLQIEMKKFLRRYFNESDAQKITEEYMKEFSKSLSQYSLDDWQRVATRHLQAGAAE